MTDYALKLPATPPSRGTHGSAFAGDDDLALYRRAVDAGIQDLADRRYDPWDKLCRRPPPDGLSSLQWWHGVKFARSLHRKPVPLLDADGNAFSYAVVDEMAEAQHRVDLTLGGHIALDEKVTHPDARDRYVVSSLMQEAITSSQIEGAVVTRDLAKEMLRSGRRPSNESERMIVNNYLTMGWLKTVKGQPLTRELVFEMLERMTRETLDDPRDASRFRPVDRDIVVGDDYGSVAHVPPPAEQLDARMQRMCDFANGRTPDRFVHPLIRSIILHFWLAYDHPFVDGNGRTARALFYWSMLRHGYWLFEFISISQVILDSNRQYYRAFLHTETDENDLTYFILYHLKVLARAVERLEQYIKRKSEQTRAVDRMLRSSVALNHRQRALLGHALRHPDERYTTESHRVSHAVAYQTARNDLLDLVDRGLLDMAKHGRRDYFSPTSDLEDRIKTLR